MEGKGKGRGGISGSVVGGAREQRESAGDVVVDGSGDLSGEFHCEFGSRSASWWRVASHSRVVIPWMRRASALHLLCSGSPYEQEIEIFQESSFKSLPAHTVGISFLRARLSKVLFSQIRTELLCLVEDIQSQISGAELVRDRLGLRSQIRLYTPVR